MEIGPAKTPAAGDLIKDTTTADFMKDVVEASRDTLVLVDFWAAWCGPCKQLAPVLEKVVLSYGGRVKLVKLDTDAHPSIAAQLRVQSLPTVYAFRDGRPLDGFVGLQTESMLRQFIDRLAGEDPGAEPGVDDILAAAGEAFDAGDLQGAAEAYAIVLQQDQTNAEALAGIARCYLQSGDTERATQMLSVVPPDKQNIAAVQAVRAALDLAGKAAGASETAALEARIAANPADHEARYDLAIALAASGYKGEALEHLLQIIRRERQWNDEAARKQLLQLFDVWGPKDEFTIEGRKRLSSILFS
jgi:putative thioredoxin